MCAQTLPPQLVAAAIREKLHIDDDNDQDILGEYSCSSTRDHSLHIATQTIHGAHDDYGTVLKHC